MLHQSLSHEIVHALKEISGGDVRSFHMLRHSCCSYLLTTLALPDDVGDAALVPSIDPTLVSHARRRRIASELLGHAATSRNVVHAVGALLGHSGEQATLRSYMHLHDWLTGIYVARPGAQRGLPASLAASLLDMTGSAVERGHRRAAARTKEAVTAQVRGRGRPREGDAVLGSVILSRLLDRCPPQPCAKTGTAKRVPNRVTPPTWQVLATLLTARNDEERRIALHQRDLDTPAGQRIAAALLDLLEDRTRGRGAVARARFAGSGDTSSGRRMRRLGNEEAERLGRLYTGLLALEPARCRSLCSLFAKGYDRPRGVLRVPLVRLDDAVAALRSADCRPDEITVERGVRTGTIKVGYAGRTDRGFLWAMLFATALHRAGRFPRRVDPNAVDGRSMNPAINERLIFS